MARFVIAVFLSFVLGVLAAPDISSSTPTGLGSSDPEATPTPTLRVSVTPTQVTPCQNLTISWAVGNDTTVVDVSNFSASYSNYNVTQTTYSPPGQVVPIFVLPISRQTFTWLVSATDPGNYVITGLVFPQTTPAVVVVQSDPFTVQPGDAGCLAAADTTSVFSLGTTPSALPPSSSQATASPQPTHKSNAGAIAGGIIAGLVVIAGLAAFWLLRRRRNRLSQNLASMNANQRSTAGKGHHRNWGGLSSIDKLQQGEIPVVIPKNSPYASPTYDRNRSQSTGHVLTDDEGLEKGYSSKDAFPVDADMLSDMPALDSNRNSRYSSDALSNAFRHNSGFSAYDEQHGRSTGLGIAAPVLTTTNATFKGGDDPFTDTAFITRSGKRTSTLSVPSTARAPSRLSDTSARPTPSPIPTPAPSAPSSQHNTMVRNTSATASVGRPSRKPVPQYTDNSIELTNTNKSSPTSHSPHSARPSRGNSHSDSSPITPSRSNSTSPTDASSHWLHDRAPVANRNIGLANQGDGPVHYLMPDLPPPAAQ